MALILLTLGIGFVILSVLLLVFPKGPKVTLKLSPAQERAFEIGEVITPDNVNEIVNFSIEEGYDHPALALRKATC